MAGMFADMRKDKGAAGIRSVENRSKMIQSALLGVLAIAVVILYMGSHRAQAIRRVLKRGKSTMRKLLLATVAACSMAGAADAAPVFVGNWDVYNDAAPRWSDPAFAPNGPLAYTGQEAAALLFGGVAADYVISTVDASVSNINNSAWYDQIGIGGGIFSQSYNNKYLGQYYGPQSNTIPGFASAFVRDGLRGEGAINYAFRVTAGVVPEPATWAMLVLGFGVLGGALRSQRKRQTTVSHA